MPQPKRRRTYHHGSLRDALISGALELIGERGPTGFTLIEAARRAGVSSAAPYRHFASREDLLAEIGTIAYGQLAQALIRAQKYRKTTAEKIAAMGSAYVTFAIAEPASFDVLFNSGIDKTAYPQLLEAGDAVLALVTDASIDFTGARRSGVTLAISCWAIAHGHAVLATGADFRHRDLPVSALPEMAYTAGLAMLEGLTARREKKAAR
jgi:AcrR family transcriptional regulator